MRAVLSNWLYLMLLATAACLGSTWNAADAKAPINVIFDTDIWGDIDDALALAMLHALHDRREVNLLAVTISTDDPWCASYVDLVNTFYGHPYIPVGIVHDGVDLITMSAKATKYTNYTQLLAERRQADASLVYPHHLKHGSRAADAIKVLRRTLAEQPDSSVVIIQVGFSTNLARLIESPPDSASSLGGTDLIKRKVRLLSVMGGNFASGQPEFNLKEDVPSAQKLFDLWPTPLVASGFEIGAEMLFPAASIENDFAYVTDHPVAEAYRYYTRNAPHPRDRPTWDLTSVLYAARPERNYFTVSRPGKITVLADGSSRFKEIDDGMHRYLTLDKTQGDRALEAMVMLASQPPRSVAASTRSPTAP